jgi:hypothetical protein
MLGEDRGDEVIGVFVELELTTGDELGLIASDELALTAVELRTVFIPS